MIRTCLAQICYLSILSLLLLWDEVVFEKFLAFQSTKFASPRYTAKHIECFFIASATFGIFFATSKASLGLFASTLPLSTFVLSVDVTS